MRRLLTLFIVSVIGLFGQAGLLGTYTVEREASLSASAEVLTLRLGSGTNVRAHLDGASVYASAATEFTVERDGTFASGSALTENELNPDFDSAATAVATHTTSISSTTVIARHTVAAAGTIVIDLSDIQLNAEEAITIRTESVTATVIINLQWRER